MPDETKKRVITITSYAVEDGRYEQRMETDGYEGDSAVPQFMRDLADAVATAFTTYYDLTNGLGLLKDAFIPQIMRAYERQAEQEIKANGTKEG